MKYNRGNALWQQLFLDKCYGIRTKIADDYLKVFEALTSNDEYSNCNDFYLTPVMSCDVAASLDEQTDSRQPYKHFDKPEHGETTWIHGNYMITLYDSEQFYLIKFRYRDATFPDILCRVHLEYELLEREYFNRIESKNVDNGVAWRCLPKDVRQEYDKQTLLISQLLDRKDQEYDALLSV